MVHYSQKSDIAVIIVLYHPSEDDLENVRILSNHYYGVIIDNSDEANFTEDKIGEMHYQPLMHNVGIAEAHNQGISIITREGKAKHVVLLDQDSRYPIDYPTRISDEFNSLEKDITNLAALGPTVIQKDTGEEYRSVIHHDKYLTDNFIERKEIIASGCCISIKSIMTIGYFDSSLFIDFVDTEWCFRAHSIGYRCGITTNIKIYHKVGKNELHIGKHLVSISDPFRYYYQYRNYLILLSRNYVPLSFKTNFGIKFLCRFFYFPLFVEHGTECWKYMTKGIIAGLTLQFKKK